MNAELTMFLRQVKMENKIYYTTMITKELDVHLLSIYDNTTEVTYLSKRRYNKTHKEFGHFIIFNNVVRGIILVSRNNMVLNIIIYESAYKGINKCYDPYVNRNISKFLNSQIIDNTVTEGDCVYGRNT